MECPSEETELAAAINNTIDGGSVTSIDYGLAAVVSLSVLLVVSMVLALVGNVMVILTIFRHRGMRTRTNMLLANLAVADILVAALDMPIAITTIVSGDWIFSQVFCYFNAFTVGLGLMLSVHTLMWISIHKYISITRPFARSVTPGKIVMMIVAAWTWTIIFNLTPTPIIGWTISTYKKGASQCGPCPPKNTMQFVHAAINTSVNLIIPIFVMSWCYSRIFKEVKDHLNRMRDFADVSVRNSLIQQKRITETLCIVMSLFILFWMPYIIYSLSLVFLGKERVPEIFNPIAYLFGYMNSSCNPIIYALRSPSFRRGFSEIICRNYKDDRPGRVPDHFGRVIVSFRRSLWRNKSKRERQQHPRNHYRGMGVAGLITEQAVRQNGTATHLMNSERMDCIAADVSIRKDQESNTPNSMPSEPSDALDVLSTAHEEMPITNVTSVNDVNPNFSLGNIFEIYDDTEETEESASVADEVTKPFMYDYPSNLTVTNEYEMSFNRQRHVSVGSSGCQYILDTSASSSSQPNITAASSSSQPNITAALSSSQINITALPQQNLNVQMLDKGISRSHQEIIFTTASIMTRHVRSVSAGDVRLTGQPSELEQIPLSCQVRLAQCSGVKKHPWPLVWQASVDSLYGSPLLSRKKIHNRKVLPMSKLDESSEKDNMTKAHGKISVSSCGSSKHLRVTAIINNVKRSLSDLLNLEENHTVHSDSDTEIPYPDDIVEDSSHFAPYSS